MSHAAEGEVRIVADRLVKRFGDFIAVNDASFEARRARSWVFSAQRRRQIDNHPHIVRSLKAEQRAGDRRGLRRCVLF
jgi:hypothetical protein